MTPGMKQALSNLRESGYAADADLIESAIAAGAEPVATGCVHHDFSILDSYIRNLRWSHDTPSEIRDAVSSNLRGLYTHLLTRGLFAGSGSWDAGRLAAAKWIEKRRCAFADEYGLVDPTTGAMEFGNGYPERDEYYCELSEIEEAVRALPAPQFVAHTVPDELAAVYMLGKIDGRRERHPLDEPAVPVAPASVPDVEIVARKMFESEQRNRSGEWTWDECSPIEREGWMELAQAAIEILLPAATESSHEN